MKIINSSSLIEYMKLNFDTLSDEQYSEILQSTLQIYVEKPTNVNDAIELIISYSSMSLQYRPLFE